MHRSEPSHREHQHTLGLVHLVGIRFVFLFHVFFFFPQRENAMISICNSRSVQVNWLSTGYVSFGRYPSRHCRPTLWMKETVKALLNFIKGISTNWNIPLCLVPLPVVTQRVLFVRNCQVESLLLILPIARWLSTKIARYLSRVHTTPDFDVGPQHDFVTTCMWLL